MTALAAAMSGIGRRCPRCGAEPDQSCTDKFGRTRFTTHIERKDDKGANA